VNLRRSAVVCIAMLMLTACGSDRTASSFDENPQPIDPDLSSALADDDDPSAIAEVQRNFLNGCVKGFGETIPDLDVVQRSGLLEVCGCSYRQLVGFSYNEAIAAGEDDSTGAVDREELDDVAFEFFATIEDDLRSGAQDLPSDVLDLIRTCVRSEAGL
jgi:hypothetical protein